MNAWTSSSTAPPLCAPSDDGVDTDLTCHVRAVPGPGWLRIRHATSNLANGMFEADCDIWDSTDRLVAQSRQLAFAPRS